jgi:putative colanic acid biosysnthesis UDP-glucose lipid carrier transferase
MPAPEFLAQDQTAVPQRPPMQGYEISEPAVVGGASPHLPDEAVGRQTAVHEIARPSESLLEAGAARSNQSRLKRALDIVGAVGGLIFLAPFLMLVALAIRFESPGPVLFRQRRTGRGGVTFHIYKFRSMTVTEDGANVVQAARDDPRVTRVGGFLRRSCVDELPQLLNVLRGDMSLVGPRPHAVSHDQYYSSVIEGYDRRFLVRPGIAGLAQVSGYRGVTPTVESMAGRVRLDHDYIAQWSFIGDVRILLRAVTEGPFHPAAL